MHRFGGRGFNNMMNLGSRTSGWFILYDIIKLLIIIAVVIFVVRMFMKKSDNQNNSTSNKAIELLKERYASGEISEEEYKDKLKNLQ